MITLTTEECKAIHNLIAQLTGGNPENVFDWDGPNDRADPYMTALAKIYLAAGADVPDNLKGVQ